MSSNTSKGIWYNRGFGHPLGSRATEADRSAISWREHKARWDPDGDDGYEIDSEDETAAEQTGSQSTTAGQQTAAASQADVPRQSTEISHPSGRGYIDGNGKFRCECGARPITNAPANISSHLSNAHNANSAKARKGLRDPRVCGGCSRTCNSFHIFQAHVRNFHGLRGSSRMMWNQWQSTSHGDVIQLVRG
ncbi:hypothetical protein F4776DRAFT_659090 [Hypoxylon sp. NC0597]|nr:hypothetical protein F4776DRAFT_659090 [Hypoxylon sp. NC0597]